MSSLSPYSISCSTNSMNNIHHNENYINDGTNLHYSIPHQLSENNSSSSLIQSTISDYYGQQQHSFHQTRSIPLYSHQNSQIYQENPNHLYRYNPLPSTTQK